MPFRAVAYQETLEQGGVPENQARAHAKAIETYVAGETITKEYFEATLDAKFAAQQIDAKLSALEQRMDAKLSALELRVDAKFSALAPQIDAKLAALKYEILKWVVGSVGAATVTILVALFRFAKP
jgi:hypothetical protein